MPHRAPIVPDNQGGLLGFLSSPQSQGLLGLASSLLQQSGPSLQPRSFGQILGGGLQQGLGAFNQAQQAQLRNETLRARLGAQQAKVEQQRQAQAAIQRVLGSVLGGPQRGPVIDGVSGQPVPDRIQQPGQQAQIAPQTGQIVPQPVGITPQPGQQLDPLQIQQAGLALSAVPGAQTVAKQVQLFGQNLVQKQQADRSFRLQQAKNSIETAEAGFVNARDRQGRMTGQVKDILNLKKNAREQSLRKEFNALETVKNVKKARIAFGKIQQSAKRSSAAGDLAMIFAFMKLIDPGSVVRESEFRTARQAKGWLGRMFEERRIIPNFVITSIQQAREGQILLPEQRQDFLDTAQGQFQTQFDEFQDSRRRYIGISQRANLDPQDVTFDVTTPNITQTRRQQTQRPPVTQPAPSQADLEFTARQEGLTVQEVKRRLGIQ